MTNNELLTDLEELWIELDDLSQEIGQSGEALEQFVESQEGVIIQRIIIES